VKKTCFGLGRIRDEEQFLSRKEVADLTRLSYHTLASWASSGEGPEFIKVGKRVLYRKSEVIRWLHEKGKRI
jgi:excisionase family DNA binding protein